MTAPKQLIETRVDVRWGDMDAFGHVNNSVYATYMEEARLRWFSTIEGGWNDEKIGPVVAKNEINFRVPIGWPEALTVTLWTERLGNSSVTIGFRIVGQTGTHYSDGATVLVWIDKSTGKSIPLPPGVRNAC
jgi:acyl-CoA thioester hydrolase